MQEDCHEVLHRVHRLPTVHLAQLHSNDPANKGGDIKYIGGTTSRSMAGYISYNPKIWQYRLEIIHTFLWYICSSESWVTTNMTANTGLTGAAIQLFCTADDITYL